MEMETDDSPAAGGEADVTPEIPETNEEVEEFHDAEDDTKIKSDPVREANEALHSENDERTGGGCEINTTPSATSDTVDEPEQSAYQTEVKCDTVSDAEHPEKNDDSRSLRPESENKSVIPTTTTDQDELDESAATSQVKCDPVIGAEPTDENSDSVRTSATTGKGKAADVLQACDESSSNMSDAVKDTSPTSHLAETCEGEEHEESADKSQVKQPLAISKDLNREQQHSREAEIIFGRLNLLDKQQNKFSPAEFLQIHPPLKQDHDTCETELVHTFLQRLMMLDYRARYVPVRQEQNKNSPVPETDSAGEEDDDFDFFDSSVGDQLQQTHVHPMDVQMAVFHSSDSFLKQNMITKLSQCLYALPLLVPDPVTMDIHCPLWSFRQITKTWKTVETKDNSNTVTMKSMPICKAKTHVVSFFRLGSLSLSKSQLMNTLINDRHNTFFHRNCAGSTKSRHLMDGVTEIAWYSPAGKPNDAFTDCTAFCNLHGDALLLEKQREILTEISSVNVVLVPTLKKGNMGATVISELIKSPKPFICLIADDSCDAAGKKGKYKMGLKDRSESDVSEKLKGIIRNILSGSQACFQLENMAEVFGIKVDEHDKVCQEGKSAAMKTIDFKNMNVSEIKDKFLPCQGQLWSKWCKTNKELYHLNGNIEKEKCNKQQELTQIRQDQYTASKDSKLMTLFIQSLSSLRSSDKKYFLKWTQILIDALSTEDLSSILHSYDKKWSEVLALKNKHDKTHLLKTKQTELEEISKQLQSANFGLEHIFREMGQVYEAHSSLKKKATKKKTDWSKYPELAAELMLSGHPMELMDGDAGHVPSIWISSLLDEVIKKLGNKRVFVLSVLGVQSSGKSTMLNAMFGLQFAVSAGRCTKGAFMQLVKVSEEMKSKNNLRIDYILVVDTEGLRALELAGKATNQHDNGLATFIVGLGNMTLINIFGENPADMQDVLQIVVQAFMRMKKVKLSPSCVFVHQNVTDIAAAEKNMDGKRRLQEKLDEMAKLAAKEEVCNAECFSDVIAFNVQEDVKYFAQLWEGSPPMAPPNPGYSESIQELKNFILAKASKSAGITLSEFKSKVLDLWNALLNENFIFSFKNTLEIAVYRKLESEYGKWTWTLRNNMLTTENELHNTIENGKLEKIELGSLCQEIKGTYEEVKKEMTTYFDDDREKEMLVQWRGRFENKIAQFLDDQLSGVKRKLDGVIQQKNARKKLDDQKTEFEKKLLEKSKHLAHELKDKTNDEKELRKQFDFVWKGWVSELAEKTTPIKDINFEEDEFAILKELSVEEIHINESKESGRYKKIAHVGDYTDYVSFTKNQEPSHTDQDPQDQEEKRKKKKKKKEKKDNGLFKMILRPLAAVASLVRGEAEAQPELVNQLSCEQNQLIRSLIDAIEQETADIVKSKPVATRGYSSTYLQEIAKNAKEKVAEFNSDDTYALKKEFTAGILLYVFDRAESCLTELHKKFKESNDAVTYLESKKSQYFNVFISFCKGSSSAVVFGELLCDKLKAPIVEAVCNKTAIGLADEMKCTIPAFSGNRLNLEKHLLKSLAEKEDFKGFINYIQRPREQAESFIKGEVQKYIFVENNMKAQNILQKNAEDIKQHVSQALFDATEKSNTIDKWVEEFSSSLNNVLTFDMTCCQNFSDINNLDFLNEEIKKGLEVIMEEMTNLSLDRMKESRMKPDQILIDQLCKCCWVKCPFCDAVCTNTLEDHSPDDHNVPFHRSTAVRGYHYKDTVEFCLDFCTTKVSSEGYFYTEDSEKAFPYKNYRTAGPKFANWKITPDESKMKYWMWFVCRFEKDLEKHYKFKFQGDGEIPEAWTKHSKEDAIESLDEMFRA